MRSQYQTVSPAVMLQTLPISRSIWEEISIDFLIGLPNSKGYEVILVVVESLSNYVHFILIKHPYSAKRIDEIFVRDNKAT